MVFREVVSQVGGSAFPVDKELALADAVADPIEAHVNGFGALLLDSVIGNAHGTFIVSLDGCGGLGVAKLCKGGEQHGGILSIEEKGAKFGFSGRGNNDAEDVAVDVDSTIERRRRRIGSKVCGLLAEEEESGLWVQTSRRHHCGH
jgi:hypothetical protein